MPVLELKQVSLAFGAQVILDHANLVIEKRERIALVGRNGVGKTTLFRTLAGHIDPDDGTIEGLSGNRIALLPQDIPDMGTLNVISVVRCGDPELGVQLCLQAQGKDFEDSPEIWELEKRVQKLISSFSLDPAAVFADLSGGMKRRVLLAKALASDPSLLLLDEPTNHLDIESVEWLETLLGSLNLALITISHDRAFIDQISNRIIELDRGHLSSWPGNYEKYLAGKARQLAEEETHNKLFDRTLREEERWIRQGIKARRTRNEGRVRALKRLREERQQRRELTGKANFTLNQTKLSGKLVCEARNIGHQYQDMVLFENFSTLILRGDKIGIIGRNGCGKSTLIKILTRQLTPDSGEVKLGTKLELATLDQHRSAIIDSKSVLDNVSDGRDQIRIDGKERHVVSYLQDFLFSPERARGPAGVLSGGERNRLMLAKLFSRPANLVVLDEPTNDLDMETLELLEHLLVDYSGTLLVVSHDRSFLNNVVTSTLAFDQPQKVNEYVGGYDDWLRQRPKAIKPANGKPVAKASKPGRPGKKLSYKDQRELDQLPATIETLEQRLEQLRSEIMQPEFYQSGETRIAQTNKQLRELEEELQNSYARWEVLEAK